MMTPEIYALWRDAWQLEHPGKVAPTVDEVMRMMDLLDISLADIGLVAEAE